MKKTILFALSACASPLLADGKRELDAHEHGVGVLNIAMEGSDIAMEFHAPGADIVGFEHPAETAQDHAAIDQAIALLSQPFDLFSLPSAAKCALIEAEAELEDDEEHDEHDHDEHAHDEHNEHEHEHDHAEHNDHSNSQHTEFHAEYILKCDAPESLTKVTFEYFNIFENALEVEVQIVTSSGAKAFEVTREKATLDLSGLF